MSSLPGCVPADAANSQHCDSWFVAAGALLLVAWICVQSHLHMYTTVDDAYIFFRYADNLLAGHGPVFNPGERVEGFTSPLWLALLALFGALGMKVTLAAAILGLAATAATMILLVYFPGLSLRPPFRLAAGALAAAHVSFTIGANSGMETPLFAFLLLASLACFSREQESGRPHSGSGFLSSLAFLARPEALMLLLVLLPLAWMCKEARSTDDHPGAPSEGARSLLSFLAAWVPLPLAYQAFRVIYYGAWVSNTAVAKLGFSTVHISMGLDYVRGFWLAHPVAWLSLLPLVMLRQRPSLILAFYGLIVTATLFIIGVGGDFIEHYRFYAPFLPVLFLLSALAAQTLFDRLQAIPLWARGSLVSLLLVLLTAAGFRPIQLARTWGENWMTGNAKLGLALARTFPRDTLVACPHIGAVGYYSKLPILDLLGLTDARIARHPFDKALYEKYPYRDPGHEKFDIPYALSRAPEVIVLSRSFSSQGATDLSEIPRAFAMEYALMEAVERDRSYRLENLRVDENALWMILRRTSPRGATER